MRYATQSQPRLQARLDDHQVPLRSCADVGLFVRRSIAIREDRREPALLDCGNYAVALLQARLNGDDIATLVGDDSVGAPTRNKPRTTLQAIKQAAWEYADGDASLRSRIEELLDLDKQRAERMRDAGAKAEA